MKSITVTTHNSINYGAALQAYALHRAQKQMKIDNKLLKIDNKEMLFQTVSFPVNRTMLINMYLNLMTLIHLQKRLRLINNFQSFVSENIGETRLYQSIRDIEENLPEADFFITGSDQVFGLRGEYDNIRTLSFLPTGKLAFSYAASLGEYDWTDEEKSIFADRLEKFAFISVREKYAKEYIESFSHAECQVHIDPVFLLNQEEWKQVAHMPYIDEAYILVYPLVSNELTQEAIDQIKSETGYKVVSVSASPLKRVKADIYISDAGPAEFLGLIANAAAVITTSFHGTALSIIFEKPFYTLIKNYKSQRMTDLLEMLGLSDRIYSGKNTNPLSIDFSKARDVIAKEKERSFAYLKSIVDYTAENK